jgi:hypothetical protein
MANTSKEIRTTSLTGRVAAEKTQTSADKQAADNIKVIARQKTACAWTIAKTMLPGAPYAEQVKFASTLMTNTLPALKVAMHQTAVNAHYTRIAEKIETRLKCDLNDLLENPSILTKEEKAVESEFKGEPKDASAKKADDRKDAGPLPAEYPEPKRDEPTELDGSNAGKGRPDSWTDGPGSKEAGNKKACEEGCKGDCGHDHSKEATKTAAEGDVDEAIAAADDAADAGEDAAAAETDAAAVEGDVVPEGAPVDGEVPAAGEGEAEPFDEELANLEDAVDDVKSDIETLEDAVSEFSNDSDDITFGGQDMLGDEGEGDVDGDVDMSGDFFGAEGGEGEEGGEELNLEDIFDEGAMADKVSALNDEDVITIEENDGDDFFAPSDAADLESVLEQEEGLTSPADMFNLEGVDNDPMASIFASKQASDEGILEPGELEDHFETDLAGDDRDAEFDHDEDIFASLYKDLKQPTRDDHRDTHPNLKTPNNKEAKVAPKQAGLRRIRQAAPSKVASTNLASLIFTDEGDFD